MNKQRKQIIESNQISKMVSYTLGGYKQKVLIKGKNANDLVIICLHGGPGSPIPFSAGCRGLFPAFTDEFIMVYWDQLGCGINNRNLDDSFTVNMFIDMTVDLIKALKGEFSNNKLFLGGVSWGSVLAAKAATKVPELIDAVVTYGQILKEVAFNNEVFEIFAKVDLPKKIQTQLQKMSAEKNHSAQDMKKILNWIRKYTQGFQCKDDQHAPIIPILKGLLCSPDYSLRDFIAIVKNGYEKNTSLLTELITIDLTDTLSVIQVPYYIIQGNTDIITSTKAISEFVAISKNNNLNCVVIENSGHVPGMLGMETLLNTVLQLKSTDSCRSSHPPPILSSRLHELVVE